MTFVVLEGPNAGDGGSALTDESGQATFTYTGDGGEGIDFIQPSFEDSQSQTLVFNIVRKAWRECI